MEPEPEEDTYRGQHRAPGAEGNAPLWNLTLNGIYPDDVYGPNGYRYYGNDAREAFSIAMIFKNKPNNAIKIYRAVPSDAPRGINPGDWVTTNVRYAREHGRDNLKNDFKITTKVVRARDIFTEGDSLEEWGYDPQPPVDRKTMQRA